MAHKQQWVPWQHHRLETGGGAPAFRIRCLWLSVQARCISVSLRPLLLPLLLLLLAAAAAATAAAAAAAAATARMPFSNAPLGPT
jgi:hypothetical protein